MMCVCLCGCGRVHGHVRVCIAVCVYSCVCVFFSVSYQFANLHYLLVGVAIHTKQALQHVGVHFVKQSNRIMHHDPHDVHVGIFMAVSTSASSGLSHCIASLER